MERLDNLTKDSQSHDFEVVDLGSPDSPKPVTKKNVFHKLISFRPLKKITAHAVSLEGKPVGKKWYRSKVFFILAGIFLIILVLGSWIAVVGTSTYKKLQTVSSHTTSLSSAIESRDLVLAESELQLIGDSLREAQNSFRGVAPLKFLPFLGNYLKDVDHVFVAGNLGVETGDLVIKALVPYADVLGFSGDVEKLEFQSAEERIIFLATTVEKLSPQMDQIREKVSGIAGELNEIDETRYPRSLMGKEIRAKITEVKKTVNGAGESLSQFQPIIKLLPTLLGNPEPVRYLLLFQNDAELRPTGGFLTAYATLNVLRGKITPGVSEDIYSLDSSFRGKVPAPDPIKKYLPLVYTWYLRDMNLSPDFKVSMDTFTKYYNQTPIAPEVDAVIGIDTDFMVSLLKILGPIGVPGYGGKFSAENDPRCDCPQVIYELENIITRPTYEIREGRKSILGPLMNSMLANMMGSPKAKWAEFFTAFTDSIREKHLLMYFFNEERQQAVESLGAAGRINSYEGDYLHINDTNFAGAKSNLFVEQEVAQDITINGDGSLTKKLTLTYRNPAPGSNCNLEAGQLCLNGLLRDWIRIYVPTGSTLVAGRGFELDMGSGEDLGHTVFDGFFTLSPEGVKKLEIEYIVPAGLAKQEGSGWELPILIQKQPGIGNVKHTITFNGGKPLVYEVDSDTELTLSK